MVTRGSAAFRREGHTTLATAGDALLVEAGPGSLDLFPARRQCGYAATVIGFQTRAIAPILRDCGNIESFALGGHPVPDSGFCLHGFAQSIGRGMGQFEAPQLRVHAILNYLHSGNWPQVFAFDRQVFYQKRWALLNLLERHVLRSDAAALAAEAYSGGMDRLERDSRLYLGGRLQQVIRRRKIDLGDLWLRAGHPLEAVSESTGFADTRDFECAYAGVKGMRCRDVLDQPRLLELDIEKLVEMLRPWFWTAPRPMMFDIPRRAETPLWTGINPGDAFDPVLSGYESEAHYEEARVKSRKDLHERAGDLFAMKETTASNIVPIFRARQATPPHGMAA